MLFTIMQALITEKERDALIAISSIPGGAKSICGACFISWGTLKKLREERQASANIVATVKDYLKSSEAKGALAYVKPKTV